MQKKLMTSVLSLMGVGLALPAWSAGAELTLELPALQGARVKRPYVAVWLEKAASHEFAGNIAVWYDMAKPNNIGATKWLPDLRSWWRISGSQASFPIDGVSGATRPAGEHTINLGSTPAFRNLAAGNYEVVVEVAREHGGHELVRLPLQWPANASKTTEVSGTQEVGVVRLTTRP